MIERRVEASISSSIQEYEEAAGSTHASGCPPPGGQHEALQAIPQVVHGDVVEDGAVARQMVKDAHG
jgi:hypothetical protein